MCAWGYPSVDGMTAEAFKFTNEFLENCCNEIVNKVEELIEFVMT